MVGSTALVFLTGGASGCRDLSGFSTGGDRFEGTVVDADFVRSGVDPGTSLCLSLDANHLQDTPGALSTSDGRFQHVPLRPIPQIWHDPLSTLSFGDGRLKNLLYVATATTTYGDGHGDDVFSVVSLMQSGGVEVRLLRGAPPASAPSPSTEDGAPPVVTDGAPAAAQPVQVFAVFLLSRESGPCSY